MVIIGHVLSFRCDAIDARVEGLVITIGSGRRRWPRGVSAHR